MEADKWRQKQRKAENFNRMEMNVDVCQKKIRFDACVCKNVNKCHITKAEYHACQKKLDAASSVWLDAVKIQRV